MSRAIGVTGAWKYQSEKPADAAPDAPIAVNADQRRILRFDTMLFLVPDMAHATSRLKP
jgi:hypothetical protein